MSKEASLKPSAFKQILKGSLLSFIFTAILILLFALVIKLFAIPDGAIKPVNQFIKSIAVFAGCIIAVSDSKGLLKGIFTGLITALLTFLVFSLFGGGFSFNIYLVLEFVFLAVIGGIAGVIGMSIKSR